MAFGFVFVIVLLVPLITCVGVKEGIMRFWVTLIKQYNILSEDY